VVRNAAVGILLALAACKGGQAATTTASASASASVPVPVPVPALEDELLRGLLRSDASVVAAPAPHVVDGGVCSAIGRPGGGFAQYLARRDLTTSFVSGDDLLAPVNRSPLGGLPPDYVPADMVKVNGASLRKDAADALYAMMAAMRERHFVARVESGYRSYAAQCGTFFHWATKEDPASPGRRTPDNFCNAVEQSALAGHSQHQLGTTVDLFTEAWFAEGEKDRLGSFRDGFACTSEGAWLDDNAWRFGFVAPYPIAPDDRAGPRGCAARWDIRVPANPRTGYRNEPWHLRFIGKDAAARFHDDWQASGPGTPDEIALEQWLRKRAGLAGDADLPVCDGCACGACATLLPDESADAGVKDPCGDASLWMLPSGGPWAPEAPPELVDATAVSVKGFAEIRVKVRAPAHTITQPPVLDAEGPRYGAGATFAALVPYGRGAHRYDDLPGAWRVAVAADGAPGWPFRASLAKPRLARVMNRANLYLPAQPGEATVTLFVALPDGATRVMVSLLRDGEAHDTRTVDVEAK
jgi:D-alanyl-D-alanine carboxypeptidase